MRYSASRDSFIYSAERHGASMDTYHLDGYLGPNGKALNTDVASLGARDAANVVVVSSGVHGVELPFGSLMQRNWMDSAQEVCSAYKEMRFVFVHALNPYGAAHGLRNDQNNIDVNRNFVDFSNTPKTSEGYHTLADAFEPRLNALSLATSWGKLLSFGLVTHSVGELKQTLAGGQYDYPKGLYYGGTRPSWSRKTWESIVQKHVISPNLQNVWHVDLHTGEGPRGKMQILVNAEERSPVYQRVQWLGEPEDIKLTHQSFAKLTGDIVDFWPKFDLPKECAVTPVCVEVGTSTSRIEGMDTLHAMITRNALRVRHKDHHRAAAKVTQRMCDTFAPMNDPKWTLRAREQGILFGTRLMNSALMELPYA